VYSNVPTVIVAMRCVIVSINNKIYLSIYLSISVNCIIHQMRYHKIVLHTSNNCYHAVYAVKRNLFQAVVALLCLPTYRISLQTLDDIPPGSTLHYSHALPVLQRTLRGVGSLKRCGRSSSLLMELFLPLIETCALLKVLLHGSLLLQFSFYWFICLCSYFPV